MKVVSIFNKKNEKDFEELIEEYKMKFYKTAKSILKNEDDVYDALQEALISIYQNFDKLENKNFFSTWGTRIVINKCYDLLRKNKKMENNIYIDDEMINCDLQYDNKKDNEKIEFDDILKFLSKEQKIITTLYYYNEYSVREIAIMLEQPEGTIKYKLSKIRTELKIILERGEL